MLRVLFSLAQWTAISVSAYQWPSPTYDALEAQLFEGTTPSLVNVANLVLSCGTRHRQGLESPLAAEWLRLAYHDVSTHNVEDGTGGLDASIFYELDRAENVGQAMKDSVNDFSTTLTKYVSYSDTIAMGVVWSVAACGGPVIPFRGGRVDSFKAGPPGVPQPQEDLATHTEKFRLQGFTQTEMISLVACGHSLGAVRSVDFPQVVPLNAENPARTEFGFFDGTAVFDHTLVAQYLDGTTKDPLVTISNKTLASDLRIFCSDGNATMKSLNSADSYSLTCSTLLERMINTVPKDVRLTEEISFLPVKVTTSRLIVQDQLLFNAILRLTSPITFTPSRTVKMFWCDRRGVFSDCANNTANVETSPVVSMTFTSVVARVMGLAMQTYEFAAPINANQSVSRFWFEVEQGDGAGPLKHDNSGTGYILSQDEIIFLPGYSTVTLQDDTSPLTLLVAAVRSDLKPTSTKLIASGNNQTALLAWKSTIELQPDPSYHLVDGYTYCSGTLRDYPSQLMIDSEVVADGISYKDDFRPASRLGPISNPKKTVSTVDTVTLSTPLTRRSLGRRLR